MKTATTHIRICQKEKKRRTRRHSRRHNRTARRTLGPPLGEHPVWERLRQVLLTATPEDFEKLPEGVDEVIRWGHALMHHWHDARQGRKLLEAVPNQLAAAIRFAQDVACDSADEANSVLRHLGLSLPGAPRHAPIELCQNGEDW